MMRDLSEVIDQMLVHIPTEQEDFISALKNQKESVRYSAPELMPLRWRTVAEILFEHMGELPLSEQWQEAVCDIWMDK